MSFADKVVLITGASSGIGASTAIHFAEKGALLSLTGRNEANLKRVAEECQKAGGCEPFLVMGDMNIEADVERVITSTIEHFGRLNVLINNAGILETGSIENTSLEQYDRLMSTNMRSPYQLTTLATPHLIKTMGNIVNVSSVAGLRL